MGTAKDRLRPYVRRARRVKRKVSGRTIALGRRMRHRVYKRLSQGLPTDSLEKRFERIYKMNLWRGDETRCGPGSSLAETEVIRRELPRIVREHDVHRLLDIPCGDLAWMKDVPLDLDAYIGADIVPQIIEDNTERFGSEDTSFVRLDIRNDPLPKVDAVLCRDCLDHFALADVNKALHNVVASGATYLLVTTYPARATNPDITTGDWRPLNLQEAPFSLPTPLELINENSAKPGYPDKSVALWRVADIAAHLASP
jgi:SAM-dependent methyltransferase